MTQHTQIKSNDTTFVSINVDVMRQFDEFVNFDAFVDVVERVACVRFDRKFVVARSFNRIYFMNTNSNFMTYETIDDVFEITTRRDENALIVLIECNVDETQIRNVKYAFETIKRMLFETMSSINNDVEFIKIMFRSYVTTKRDN